MIVVFILTVFVFDFFFFPPTSQPRLLSTAVPTPPDALCVFALEYRVDASPGTFR